MKDILINDDISPFWGIGEDKIRNQMEKIADGEEARIVVNSLGGDVFTGIEIFNLIRDFATKHPVTVVIEGIAASIASYIALAAKIGNPQSKIKIYDNSIFFIHNARTYAEGDAQALQKAADECKKLSDLIRETAYAKLSSDSADEIQRQMDAETLFVGSEIIEHGYADELISAEKTPGEVISAQADILPSRVLALMRKVGAAMMDEKNSRYAANLRSRIYAENDFFRRYENKSDKKNTEVNMTIQDFKAKEPDLYKIAFDDGASAAVKAERERVSALLAKFGKAGDSSQALSFIQSGESITDEKVIDALLDVSARTRGMSARIEDDPPAVTVREGDRQGGEDESFAAAFRKEMGV